MTSNGYSLYFIKNKLVFCPIWKLYENIMVTQKIISIESESAKFIWNSKHKVIMLKNSTLDYWNDYIIF